MYKPKKNNPDDTKIFRCARCDYLASNSEEMRDHINEVHGGSGHNLYSRVKPIPRDIGLSWYGFIAGLIVGYIVGYALTYYLGFFGIIIYTSLSTLILSYAIEYKEKFLRSFGIGCFGIIPGFIIDAIIGYGAKRGTAYKIFVFIIGTGVAIGIYLLAAIII